MDKPLVNKVAQSSLKTINLEAFYPQAEMVDFDLKDYLFHGLILKEKDFRKALKEHDWTQHEGQILLVYCSTDAIIPVWAYMLVSAYAEPYASVIFQGAQDEYLKLYYQQYLADLDLSIYADERIVIKGCSDRPVPPAAYAQLTTLLRPLAKSIMYGEPCSTVPIYKKPRVKS